MSMHKKPLTDLEHKGLELHGLDIGTPSQLSDCFRHGVKWALEQDMLDDEAIEGCLEWLATHDQTVDVGVGHIESTAGLLTRYLKSIRSNAL